MQRIKDNNASATLPAYSAGGSVTGYFQVGDPENSIPPTKFNPDWCNQIQEEQCLAIEESGLILSSSELNQLAQTIGRLSKRRNVLINGRFQLWDYATTQTTTGYGSANRWLFTHTGVSTKTVTRQTFYPTGSALAAVTVPNAPSYFVRQVLPAVAAGAGNSCLMQQRIEYVKTFNGTKATLTFWAKADAPKNIAVSLDQFFGVTGASAAVNGNGVLVAITASWAKYKVTFDVPSITGKTLGTDVSDYLSVNFWLSAGSNFNARSGTLGEQAGTFEIAEVQFESGSIATDIERRPESDEQRLSNRFYQASTSTFASIMSGDVTSGQTYYAQYDFKDTMRAIPTITLTNVSQINFPATVGATTDTIYGFHEGRVANGTGRGFFGSSYTASAEL